MDCCAIKFIIQPGTFKTGRGTVSNYTGRNDKATPQKTKRGGHPPIGSAQSPYQSLSSRSPPWDPLHLSVFCILTISQGHYHSLQLLRMPYLWTSAHPISSFCFHLLPVYNIPSSIYADVNLSPKIQIIHYWINSTNIHQLLIMCLANEKQN